MIAVLLLASVMFFGLISPSFAVAPYNWSYAYYGRNSDVRWYTQNVDSFTDKWQRAPGYGSSSCYYYLSANLGSSFNAACHSAAALWTAQDSAFHFYEVSTCGDQYDHTIGMSNCGDDVADTYWYDDYSSGTAKLTTMFMRFNTLISWTDGASPNTYDRLSVAVHEFGHAAGLQDVDGSWTWSGRPSMEYYDWGNSIDCRTLSGGDIYGIQKLY